MDQQAKQQPLALSHNNFDVKEASKGDLLGIGYFHFFGHPDH